MSVKEDELLEEVAGFLHGYLKAGKVTIHSFFSKINMNITNLKQLLTVRFLLKEETKDFIRKLPHLLQRFKTTTVLKNEVIRGEIRGEIDWHETIKERLAGNYGDTTMFSTNESIRTYETPENLVLKELLKLLYQVLYKDDLIKGLEDLDWFQEWKKLKTNVAQAYEQNIYLQRVKGKHVSTRTIVKTKSHRNKLYRDAASLLLEYRKITNGQYTEEDIQTLLQETFIKPENKDVLFELYWVVQLIKQNTTESTIHLLKRSQNMVASWSDEVHDYHLYHDSTGSGEVKFSVTVSEIRDSDNVFLQQKHESFSTFKDVAGHVFNANPTDSIWGGRPDFLVEIYDKYTGELVRVVVGEVKNTSSVKYAVTGLKELMDYIYLAKDRKGNYMKENGSSIQGMLCLGNVPFRNSLVPNAVKVASAVSRNNLTLS